MTYTSFNVLDKLFLSCSLPDFQNSNPVMFTPLHIRYYLIIFDTKIVKKFENSKISNFVKKCSPDEYPKYVRFLEERRRTFIDHVKFSLSLVCSLKYRFIPLFALNNQVKDDLVNKGVTVEFTRRVQQKFNFWNINVCTLSITS